jgi:predicted RNase H-like HicB family nuclease
VYANESLVGFSRRYGDSKFVIAGQGLKPRLKAPKAVPVDRSWKASADIREYDIGTKTFTAVVERDADTGLFVGWVPGFPGAHSQGETLDELRANLGEVVEMLLEDGVPEFASEFVGTQTVEVA